jgi:hypothetical protein
MAEAAVNSKIRVAHKRADLAAYKSITVMVVAVAVESLPTKMEITILPTKMEITNLPIKMADRMGTQ